MLVMCRPCQPGMCSPAPPVVGRGFCRCCSVVVFAAADIDTRWRRSVLNGDAAIGERPARPKYPGSRLRTPLWARWFANGDT